MIQKDFNSFKNILEWDDTYKIFMDNKKSISMISKYCAKKYNFTEEDMQNSFLYEIMSFQYSEKKLNIFFSKNYLKYLLIYIFVMLVLLLYLPFLFIINLFRKKQKFDVLYEEMWDKRSWYSRYYIFIDNKLKKSVKKGILFLSLSMQKIYDSSNIDKWNGKTVDIRDNNKLFDFSISLTIIIKDIFYIFSLYKISKKHNLNFIYLYLMILRRLLLYSSQVSNIESKVLISAGDYYWNPLRYMCYKRKIQNIILLQHNNKDNYLFGRLFPYCDYYYGYSKGSISKLEGINFSKKYAVGSFQLIDFLKQKDTLYDILFINQTVYDKAIKFNTPNLNQEKLIYEHNILIDNFKKYLSKNKDINALYVCKPTYLNIMPAKIIQKDFKNIKNIRFVESYGQEMFSNVSKSKLIINIYSGVGIEAYGLDKKVLWINYNKCCELFEIDTKEEDLHVMINDTTYEAFEERVNLLLSENEEVDEHYKKLKEKYMNIQENPAKIVADKINELIMKDSK